MFPLFSSLVSFPETLLLLSAKKRGGRRKSLSSLSRLTGSGSSMLYRSPFFMSPETQGPFWQVEWKKLGKGSKADGPRVGESRGPRQGFQGWWSRVGETDRAAVWEVEKDILCAWRERRRNRLSQSTRKSQKTIFVCLFVLQKSKTVLLQTARCQDPWFGEHNTDWILGPIAQLYTEALCPGIMSQGLHVPAQCLQSDYDFPGWRRRGMLREVVGGCRNLLPCTGIQGQGNTAFTETMQGVRAPGIRVWGALTCSSHWVLEFSSFPGLWNLLSLQLSIFTQGCSFSSVAQSCPTLWPHELQHARSPCPSPTPGVHPNSSPLSRWCHANLILCCPLLFLPSIFPSIRVFTNESALHIRWPKYWGFSFSISPSNEYSGLISFRMDWLDLLAVQGILKSLLQRHSSKGGFH